MIGSLYYNCAILISLFLILNIESVHCIWMEGDDTFSIIDATGGIDIKSPDINQIDDRFNDHITNTGSSLNLNTEVEIPGSETILLQVDPPSGTFSPTALGAYLWTDDANARIYYSINGSLPTLNSPSLNSSNPYIHLETFKYGSNYDTHINLVAIAARYDIITNNWYRSNEINVMYNIESDQRAESYAFFAPGLESQGNFLRVALELPALPRAQIISGQEYADFYTFLGIAPYANQNIALQLLNIDSDLTGFEGAFSASVPKNATHYYRYGYLVPHYNGKKLFGKVVRINLHHMGLNVTSCAQSVRWESYDSTTGGTSSQGQSHEEACVVILDLETLHPRAVGFRRGFTGTYPYAYLSPGEYDVPVRVDLAAFSIETTKYIILSDYNQRLGGYSGGFSDGDWSCFSPLRTFVGPVGGLRSSLPVDADHLEPYFHGVLLCIKSEAWGAADASSSLRTFDFEGMDMELRGFSNVVRVGRYAYFSPYAHFEHKYSAKVVRLNLGPVSIGDTLDNMATTGASGRTIIDVLELSIKDSRLRGFADIFSSGKYIYFVPFRDTYEPDNGQRGSGVVARVDMNIFDLSGVTVVDMPTTSRPQIPSFPEDGLRGFSGGFASGKYGVLVPFYNGKFSGKSGRFNLYTMEDVQEVDLTQDRNSEYFGIFKGFRGGFVSNWPGMIPETMFS